MLWSKTQTTDTPLNQTECLLSPFLFYGKSGSAVTKNVRYSDRPARMTRAILRSDVRINPPRGFFSEKSGALPDRQSRCPYYYSRVVVNPRIAMFWPCAVRPAARTKSKRTPSNKRKDRRFESLVARYYRGVCTFASRLTDDPVEAVLLTHAAFTRTRNQLRSRDQIRFVTILLTNVRHVVSQMFKGQLTF